MPMKFRLCECSLLVLWAFLYTIFTVSRIEGGQKRTICRFIVKVRRREKNVTIMRMRIDWFWLFWEGRLTATSYAKARGLCSVPYCNTSEFHKQLCVGTVEDTHLKVSYEPAQGRCDLIRSWDKPDSQKRLLCLALTQNDIEKYQVNFEKLNLEWHWKLSLLYNLLPVHR